MALELLVATVMVCLTVFIHGWGLAILGNLLHPGEQEGEDRRLPWGSPRSAALTMATVLGLFVLHGLEIWLYAALYHALGAVPDIRTAIYFSTSTYAAIGYGDQSISEAWRLVGAIEGINGIILIGWSTAFFVTVMTRFRNDTHVRSPLGFLHRKAKPHARPVRKGRA